MIRRARVVLSGAIVLACGQPGIAQDANEAPTLRYTVPMLPFLYGYAACLFATNDGNAELAVAGCGANRASLISDAKSILPSWHRGFPKDSIAVLSKAFDDLEQEMRFARKNREAVPAEIVGYLDCTSRYLLKDDGYRDGLYMEGFRADGECRQAVREAWNGDIRKLSRALYRQIALGGTFRPARPGGGPWIARMVSLKTDRHGLMNPPSER